MPTGDGNNIKVGILALQGSFSEHAKMIQSLGYESFEVRKVNELENIDGLIIPGGESTTMKHHLALSEFGLLLKQKIDEGLPVYGTCAGAILLAKKINGRLNEDGLNAMNIDVLRNAYGAQLDSFEEEITVNLKEHSYKIPAIYIRAPKINSIGDEVKVLSKNNNNEIVMALQRNILVTTFHPELTQDKTVHSYFVETIIRKS